MQVVTSKPLFAWDCLEDSPSLTTIEKFLAAIADGRLLNLLQRRRGCGRDDYPVHALWGTLLLHLALRHVKMEDTLEELSRNGQMRRLIGIESERGVPKALQDPAGPDPEALAAAPPGG